MSAVFFMADIHPDMGPVLLFHYGILELGGPPELEPRIQGWLRESGMRTYAEMAELERVPVLSSPITAWGETIEVPLFKDTPPDEMEVGAEWVNAAVRLRGAMLAYKNQMGDSPIVFGDLIREPGALIAAAPVVLK